MNSERTGLSASQRLQFAGLDAITALLFLWTWIAPGSVFFATVEAMEMAFVIEFASLHAAGMLMLFLVSTGMKRWQRILGIAAMGSFYLGFFGWLGLKAGIWWPAAVMLIFVFGKIRHVISNRMSDDDSFHFGLQWGGSTVLFVLLTGLAFMLPWPHLGIPPSPDEGKVHADGATQAASHAIVVAGFLYFASMAAIKYRFAAYFNAHGAER
ncbi:hypothetical protein [Dokdonella sp.]|uniref:hypothetical protein n=1 Tax=Dokdonella sp. TaxID=2291710 RepID=UPI003C556D4D